MVDKHKIKPNHSFYYPENSTVFSVTTKIECDDRGVPIGLNSEIKQHLQTCTDTLDMILRDLGYVKLKKGQRIYSCFAADCDEHHNFEDCKGCMNEGSWDFV